MFTQKLKFKHSETGQGTIEFIIACFVLIPLFFGVYYLARYSDIKQAGIQASRYAAFERAWDPTSSIKSDAVIENEVRSRFFTDNELIQYQQNPEEKQNINLWVQADSKKLLNKTTDVKLFYNKTHSFSSNAVFDKFDLVVQKGFNLPKSDIVKAEINIPLSNIAHFEPLSNINLNLPAATAIGSGSWNSSGSDNGINSTCSRINNAILGRVLDNKIVDFLNSGIDIFEPSAPKFGIRFPDYVPPGSLRKNNSSSTLNTPLEDQARVACE